MSDVDPVPINSLKELQKQMPRVLEALNANEALALAATGNPLLALEYLNFQLSPQARLEIEKRARFGPELEKEIDKLEKQIRYELGEELNLVDRASLTAALKKRFKGKSSKKVKRVIEFFGRSYRPGSPKEPDDLKDLEKLDPVLPALFRYNFLDRRYARFGTSEAFERVLNKELKVPIQKVRFRLQERSRRKKRNS